MTAPDAWLRKRLQNELNQLEEIRCPAIDFRRPSAIPFEHLYVTYRIRSIIDLDDRGLPVYHDRFNMVVDLPPTYPQEPPVVRMASGVAPPFHPNFWSLGPHYGLVCIHGGGTAVADPSETLALLLVRVGRMLQYDPQVTQFHEGPNNRAAYWYEANKHRADLFPTDRQRLPLPGGGGIAPAEEDDGFVIVGE